MTTPEDQDPLLNTVLGGARIQRRVSAGLLANVYLGHYAPLNVPVAVKVLSPKATAQGMNKERFVREGRALAQLTHNNIIRIYNVGHENGRYFIVMDWIQDGMNLRQLAQSRPLTPPQSLKVLRRLAEALEYIHGKGLVHRDIKPANICLRKGGHPVLMDFSLIKDQTSDVQLTAPGTIMGTVNFMPPEQAQPGGPFGNVGPWSDVYSLGGTLYWLLTGRPPFKGRTPMETIIKLIREPYVPASQINPSLPPEVDAFLTKCLAKKPEERFPSTREFMAAIDELATTQAEALARAVPPAPAADEEGGSGAPAGAPGSAPATSPGQPPAAPRAWGAAGSSSSSMPAVGGPAPSGARPAVAAAPAPASMPAVLPMPSAQPSWSPASAPAAAAQMAPRGSTRLASGTVGEATAPRPSGRLGNSSPTQPALASPATAVPTTNAEWKPANGLDVPPDDAATIRVRGPQGQGYATGAPPPAVLPTPPLRASTATGAPQAGADLKRSWVEDVASQPSWTEQEKDSGTSAMGLSAPPTPTDTAAPPSPMADAKATGKTMPPPAPPRSTDPRVVKARPPRVRRSGLETALVVTAIIVIVVCLLLAAYVLFAMNGK